MFPCKDCRKYTVVYKDETRVRNEFYMVHDHLWRKVHKPGEKIQFLCFNCLEKRLGRKITAKDLTDWPVNDEHKSKFGV